MRANLARLWAVLNSPLGDEVVAHLRRLKTLPAVQQERIAQLARVRLVASAPASADRSTVVRWLLDHAIVRGLFLPGLGRADLFTAFAEMIGSDDDIAAIMDRDRNWRAPAADARRLDQRKVMTRRSRLNARRKAAGYRNL